MDMITIRATQHDTAHEALQWLDAAGDDVAVMADGRIFSMRRVEAEKMETAGVDMAFIHERDGQIFTIPVNSQ